MDARILDLDGSLLLQHDILDVYQPRVLDLRSWGPRIRMACSFRQYRQFERAVANLLGGETDDAPHLTLFGSGDFHHVSLALLRRLRHPCNLLVLDKHPDWMRGIPLLHCGTWLFHAGRLPQVRRIFHVGGELDFDNSYRWLAPWPWLHSGKITVLPAVRSFGRGSWARIANEPVRPNPEVAVNAGRLCDLLRPFTAALAEYPLYVSVDKDVLVGADAAVNWDSGMLVLEEVRLILEAFLAAAEGKLAGADLLGDWSPVQVQGLLRHFLDRTEHPLLAITPGEAARRNVRANLALLTGLCLPLAA